MAQLHDQSSNGALSPTGIERLSSHCRNGYLATVLSTERNIGVVTSCTVVTVMWADRAERGDYQMTYGDCMVNKTDIESEGEKK